MLEQRFEARENIFRLDHVEQFHAATVKVFGGGAGVGAVAALAGEDENQIIGGGEPAGVPGDFLANAPDDLGPRLARGPGGVSHSRICAMLMTGTDIFLFMIDDLRLTIYSKPRHASKS